MRNYLSMDTVFSVTSKILLSLVILVNPMGQESKAINLPQIVGVGGLTACLITLVPSCNPDIASATIASTSSSRITRITSAERFDGYTRSDSQSKQSYQRGDTPVVGNPGNGDGSIIGGRYPGGRFNGGGGWYPRSWISPRRIASSNPFNRGNYGSGNNGSSYWGDLGRWNNNDGSDNGSDGSKSYKDKSIVQNFFKTIDDSTTVFIEGDNNTYGDTVIITDNSNTDNSSNDYYNEINIIDNTINNTIIDQTLVSIVDIDETNIDIDININKHPHCYKKGVCDIPDTGSKMGDDNCEKVSTPEGRTIVGLVAFVAGLFTVGKPIFKIKRFQK